MTVYYSVIQDSYQDSFQDLSLFADFRDVTIYIQYLWSDFDRASSLICGNKTPTRCNRWYLLQILLHAQHVSDNTMPIIRSSIVLYRWSLPVVFGAAKMEKVIRRLGRSCVFVIKCLALYSSIYSATQDTHTQPPQHPTYPTAAYTTLDT